MAKIVQLRDRETTEKQYPVTIPQAVVDDAGRNILEIIETYFKNSYTEEDVMYGVEWDVTVASPAMTRIGNMALHRQLPIQNRMKGCLLGDDGTVNMYLNPTSWEGAPRDGSQGQVMVEIPDHYRKFETDGNIRRVKISEYPLAGYHYVPKCYISAYEATVQLSTDKLCSVMNDDPDYRGGTNNASYDDTYRSLLGRPVVGKSRPSLRSAAHNRGNGWEMLTYDAYKTTLWLYIVEYANRNSQEAFTEERTAEGFRRGGLGVGFTMFPNHGTFNSYDAIVPCGHTDSLGNASGEVSYTSYGEDGAVWDVEPVCRYRGIENIFGSVISLIDGLVVSDGNFYTTSDSKLYGEILLDGYLYAGEVPIGGFVKDVHFGEYGDFTPKETGGGSSQYWCDNYIAGNTYAGVGGSAVNAYNSGVSALITTWGAGTRLCFIPKNE